MRGIINNGLRIPGTGGVRVVNGSAYGVGIYTANNPQTSVGYTRGVNMMFVCVGARFVRLVSRILAASRWFAFR
jgi:hypothetical protein